MASIKVKFRPSSVENSEGTLYYQIIHNRVVRQVKTDFKIKSCEWNEMKEETELQSNKERDNYLNSIHFRIRCGLDRFAVLEKELSTSKELDTLSADDMVKRFEEKLTDTTLFNFMEGQIANLKRNGQVRTAETYQTTLNSFKRYRGECDLPLGELSQDIIESYQCFLKRCDVRRNTISFYMKRLRAVCNKAMEQNHPIQAKLFKNVYTGMDKTVKRAISMNSLKSIKALNLKSAQDYARDMFLLSFYMRGMSFVDMSYLLKSNLNDGQLTYCRRKTHQHLNIEWDESMQKLIDKYPVTDSPYLLPILKPDESDLRKQYQKKLANVNRNLKIIGKAIGLKTPLTMYSARHTWSSVARDMNIPLSVISEGLGHDNQLTTTIYLSNISSEAIDKANKKIIKALR